MSVVDHIEFENNDLKLVQAKIPEKLLREVQKKMKREGVTWNKLFKAACIDYLLKELKK